MVRVWIISGYGAATSWRLTELPDGGHYALGIPANDSVSSISHRPRNALAPPGPYGNDGFFSCEAFLGQVDFDVDPFTIGGVNPGQDQYSMAWSHLVPDGPAQLRRVAGVVDRVVLGDRIVPEREIPSVPEKAVDPGVLVSMAPRVADEEIVGLHGAS